MTTTSAPITGAATRLVDPTIGFRRRTTAVALPLAFALQAVTNTLYSLSVGDGVGDTGSGDETLAFYAAHGGAMTVATIVSLIGSLLVVPGVLAALRVLRPTRPRLSLAAGILMIAGYIAYFGIVFTNYDTIALARFTVDAGAALDERAAIPGAIVVFLLFVAGNLVGTLLLGLAVILSRSLPWWAGALIIGWPVGHVVNLVVGSEWFAVAGGALEVIGLCVVAVAALRLSNAEWAARG
ncbi:hypothetical protein GCM10009775_28150 [Microbacterium aoyamense]|uniref:DUF4386 domain-containing protein n=1 Tax=Microbacterium aoyamense TaxID=344166 RepID=A0ABP5B8F6_9MICO|nr:hypothetical protein [Microbacterium aoyamense]